ncbi:MAG: transketolase [Acidobacteria bacterium]|nr:transketolase [Acidobacteriota bacterium]
MNREQTIRVLQEKANRLRVDCLRATTEAGSGHPTSCLSAAELVATLFFHVMRYDPRRPDYAGNDRFVLSKGHAAPILYAAWAEAGALPVERLLELRKFGSTLEGHPTPRFPGALVATGALGQGLSMAAGMALAAKRVAQADWRVYALLGDGECAEGSVWEAAAWAAYYKLDNLVAIVDVNRLGQSQPTMYQHDTSTYARRFAACGWQAFELKGHDLRQILDAFERIAQQRGQPAAIIARTLKGKGVSFLEDKEGWHGKAVPRNELAKALAEIPVSDNPGQAVEILPPPAPASLPAATGRMEDPAYQPGQKVATREAYGSALVKLGRANARVVALDGDVKNSTFAEVFTQAHPERFFECFIAEQNMIGVAVGLATTGLIPFASTFAAFHTRAYDFIRMAAISRANLKLLGTHCGVSIGEDGPSQMGLEDLAMMRAIPGSVVLYPCDAVAMERLVAEAADHQGIVYLRATRPKTPVLYPNTEKFPIGGAKVLRRSDSDAATVVAGGVTVYEALAAHDELAKQGIALRVIDAYSVKPMNRATLLEAARATNNTLIVVEDHYYDGGLGDAVLSALAPDGVRVLKLAVQDIPTSGKPQELLDAAGISARHIIATVKKVAGR